MIKSSKHQRKSNIGITTNYTRIVNLFVVGFCLKLDFLKAPRLYFLTIYDGYLLKLLSTAKEKS